MSGKTLHRLSQHTHTLVINPGDVLGLAVALLLDDFIQSLQQPGPTSHHQCLTDEELQLC